MAIDDARSEAMILFLGRGISPYPKRDPERLTERFGNGDGFDLIRYVQSVLDEMYDVQPDWSQGDLASETDKALNRVRTNHPELSDDALAALRWSFSWDWK
jgi:hypothetical protein